MRGSMVITTPATANSTSGQRARLTRCKKICSARDKVIAPAKVMGAVPPWLGKCPKRMRKPRSAKNRNCSHSGRAGRRKRFAELRHVVARQIDVGPRSGPLPSRQRPVRPGPRKVKLFATARGGELALQKVATAAHNQQPSMFFRGWTRIEAAVKAYGRGLDDALSCFDGVSCESCAAVCGVALAVAAHSEGPLSINWHVTC